MLFEDARLITVTRIAQPWILELTNELALAIIDKNLENKRFDRMCY